MADAPAERGTARQPHDRGHEDTVALQIPAPPNGQVSGESNGQSRNDSIGQAKVLPPMPPPETKPPKPAKAKPTARQPKARTSPPGPKPAGPPAQAKVSTPKPKSPKPAAAPAAGAAAAGVAAAVVTTAPAPAPARPSTKAPRPAKVKTARPPKPAKAPKPAKTPKAKPAKAPKTARPPGRRARLRMTRIDPWSVMKTSFLLSIALGIVTVVSVFMVWSVLDAADVWSSINQTVQGVVGGQEAANFDIENYIGTRRVLGFTMIVAAVDVVLLTAIATLGAFLYNMSASLLGGIEVTLAEDN